MDAVKTLKIAIVSQWVLHVLAAIASSLEENNLPEALQSYLAAEYDKEISVVLWIGIVMLVAFVVASVGVFRLKAWGRNLYVALVALGAVLNIFFEPIVETPISGGLSYLATVTCGLTVGLLFFSAASRHFDSTTNKKPDRTRTTRASAR